MGLLDDAIREHLDLKRRRGADPTEVARLEHEALGPVRREPAPADIAEEHTHVQPPEERHEGAHGDPLRDAVPHEEPAHAILAQEQHDEPATSAHDMANADRAGGVAEDDSATPLAESPRAAAGPARSNAEPEPDDPHAMPDDLLQPTTEFHVEDHHDHDDEQAGPDEDVLEETPDFLQETPEHDRLWFEQRPPRDFDFDG